MATKKACAPKTKAAATAETKVVAAEATAEKKSTETKATEKVAATKAEAKKPSAKKTTAKKTTAKKSVSIEAKTVLQYAGKDVVTSDILETVKKVWVEKFQGKLEEVKTIEIYVKPEENRAYFVINGLGNGDYFVEL